MFLLNSFKFYCYKKRITFKEVYELWSKDYFEKIAPSTQRTWVAAFKHSHVLHDMKINEIKVRDLEDAIRAEEVGDATKVRMKCLFNVLYKYAIKHELVNKNVAVYCDTPSWEKEIERLPFSRDEIEKLWNNLDKPFVDMILVGIYLGFRPSELVGIKVSDVNLEDGFIRGGLKTKAGRNRFVPIHDDVLGLIKARVAQADEYLFVKESGEPMNYFEYRRRFNKVMKRLNMHHFPHDTRHTFITLAKECDVNEYVLKLIVGHAVQDITEGVYTHRNRGDFYREICKIKV